MRWKTLVMIFLTDHGLDIGLILYFVFDRKNLWYYLCALRIDLSPWLIFCDLIQIVAEKFQWTMECYLYYFMVYMYWWQKSLEVWYFTLTCILAQSISTLPFTMHGWCKDLGWIVLGWKAVGIQDQWVCVKVLKGWMTLKNQLTKPTDCWVVIKCTYHR